MAEQAIETVVDVCSREASFLCDNLKSERTRRSNHQACLKEIEEDIREKCRRLRDLIDFIRLQEGYEKEEVERWTAILHGWDTRD